MAAANGPISGRAQKQRLKYDPIALRQPREPEMSGWKKFLRFFIHERVREVDRRDRCCGLTVWFLVVVAYGVYLFFFINGRLEQRLHPPISVNMVEHKPLTAQAGVTLRCAPPHNTSNDDWDFQVNFIAGYINPIDGGQMSSSCPTCAVYSQEELGWNWYLTLTEAFKGAPDELTGAWLLIYVSLSRRGNTTNNDGVPESLLVRFVVGHSCALLGILPPYPECQKEKITGYGDFTTIGLSKRHPSYLITLEADKFSKLPDRWQPSFSLPSWLTGVPGKVHKQWETWSYRLRYSESGYYAESDEARAVIQLDLPELVTTYEEQEPFDVLTMFGIAAGTWGAVVFVITLLLPMRPSGRRRIWPCCWRLSAKLLNLKYYSWDDMRRRGMQQEMDGDIEEEMKEVENQPGYADIAELELPSMEDRMARTERVLRRLMSIREPSRLEERLVELDRRQQERQQVLNELSTQWVQEQERLNILHGREEAYDFRLRQQRRQVDLQQMQLDALQHELNVVESELELSMLNVLRLNEGQRQPWRGLQAAVWRLRGEQERQQQVLTKIRVEQERHRQRFMVEGNDVDGEVKQ